MSKINQFFLSAILILCFSCEKEDFNNFDYKSDLSSIENHEMESNDSTSNQLAAGNRKNYPELNNFYLDVRTRSTSEMRRRYRRLILDVRAFMNNYGGNGQLTNGVTEMRTPEEAVYRIRVQNDQTWTDYYFSVQNMYLIGVGFEVHDGYNYRRLQTNDDTTTWEHNFWPAPATRSDSFQFRGDYPDLERRANMTRFSRNLGFSELRLLGGYNYLRSSQGNNPWHAGNVQNEAATILYGALLLSEAMRFDPVAARALNNIMVHNTSRRPVRLGQLVELTNNWARITRELRARVRNNNRGGNEFTVGPYVFRRGDLQVFATVLAIALRPQNWTGSHH